MAFTACTSNLTKNITTDCIEPRIKGWERVGLLIKKSDIDFSTAVDDGSGNVSFALLATKKVAVIYNKKANPLPFGGTQVTYNRDADGYDKKLQFYYEGIGATNSKAVVEPLKSEDYVVVLERKQKYGDGAFPVFGYQVGLSCANDGGAQVLDEETGYWLITMTCTEPAGEIELSSDGTYETAKVVFDSLKALAY